MAKRLCLVDDLKMLKITMSNTSSRNKLNPEINDHYNIFTGERQKNELKTQDKALAPAFMDIKRVLSEYCGDLQTGKHVDGSWSNPKSRGILFRSLGVGEPHRPRILNPANKGVYFKMVDSDVAPPKCRSSGYFRAVNAYDIYSNRLQPFINTRVEGGVAILYALNNCAMRHISYVAHTFAGESSYACCNGGQDDDAQTIKAVRTGKRKLQHIAM
ncbi:hypothetical protein Tco_1307007 [Tanacetum coccineum]